VIESIVRFASVTAPISRANVHAIQVSKAWPRVEIPNQQSGCYSQSMEKELHHELHEINATLKAGFEWIKSHHGFATKHDLKEMEKNIMSAISDFAAKQTAFNDRLDQSVAGLTQDVRTLNDKITELQNSAGTITPEDQALLDAIQARSETIATKLEALDALTPPPPPVA